MCYKKILKGKGNLFTGCDFIHFSPRHMESSVLNKFNA